MNSGVPYEEVIDEVKALLMNAIVIGDNILCDFDALELSMQNSGVHCISNTATNADFNALVSDKPLSKLRVLAECC